MKEIIGITSLILAVFFWIPTLLAADPTWEYIYEGDILPDDTSLGDNAWQLMGDNKFAEITNQGELHIDDVGVNHCFFLYNIADAALMQQATIEARVKVLSQSGANFEVLVGMQDGSNSKWLDLFPDHILLNNTNSTYDVDMTEYHILRMVRDTEDIHIYVDDEEVISEPHVGAGETWIGFIFGAGATVSTSEQYWDYLVFTTEGGFSPEELPSYASTRKPELAAGPKPADGALHSDTWVNISWRAGDFAVSHDVYFSYDSDDVENGAPEAFQGNQVGTFLVVGFPGFAYPDGLVPGTTYYWRIDEVNDTEPNSPWKGSVWSFSIPPKTAYEPDPADNAELVATDASLSWTAGFGAKLHTVYFGDNFEDVDNAAGGLPQGTSTYDPGPLELAQTYYWRVDEFDIIDTHKGDVWSFTTQGAVSNPDPSNGAVDVKHTQIITWSPSVYAASHEVYFGADKDAVKNADTGSPEYKGARALGSETYDPGMLEWNSTYYWRIDEVNNTNPDSPWTGPLWSFTTANFLVIDDFEDYDVGNNEIWWSWIDGLGYASHPTLPAHPGNGTGSMVGDETTGSYMEETIVHGGNQSMPVFYDNSNLRYSEVEKTLTYPRDWSEKGVNKLSIWFRGVSDNATETLYVVLNGSAVVSHDNPDAAQIARWTEWTIDLQAFGVNLANVNTIALGLGNRNPDVSGVAGGSGTMYFDDIRLYPPPEPAP
jgi:hypothetical protein